jgi:endonuclease/exonuclease/phosphatase family metal-dependent hydrolase
MATPLKVFSWNIAHFVPNTFSNNWNQHVSDVATAIPNDADIVMLQEAWESAPGASSWPIFPVASAAFQAIYGVPLPSSITGITSAGGLVSLMAAKGYPYYISSPFGNDILNAGLITFSKHPITASAFSPWGSESLPDSFSNKGFLKAQIQIGGASVQAINVHTQAGWDATSKATRAAQIAQLRTSLVSPGKYIIAGDFNFSRASNIITGPGGGDTQEVANYTLLTTGGNPTLTEARNLVSTDIDYIFMAGFCDSMGFATYGRTAPEEGVSDHFTYYATTSLLVCDNDDPTNFRYDNPLPGILINKCPLCGIRLKLPRPLRYQADGTPDCIMSK